VTTIEDTITLTDAGRQYALAAAEFDSRIGCVALTGRESGWPETHNEAAIRLCNKRGREIKAEAALLACYEGPWGLKASEEDALLAVLRADRPDLGEENLGIYALRGNPRMSQLADQLGELLEEGLTLREIAEGILSKIDETRLP
jgi:hypothetical protein